MTNPTDRELLELAAKAVGYEHLPVEGFALDTEKGMRLVDANHEFVRYWNPLRNNYDAQGLAIAIGAYDCIRPDGRGIWGINGETNEERLVQVRRSLVQAAAKIGAAKQFAGSNISSGQPEAVSQGYDLDDAYDADQDKCPTCGEDGGTSCGAPACGLLSSQDDDMEPTDMPKSSTDDIRTFLLSNGWVQDRDGLWVFATSDLQEIAQQILATVAVLPTANLEAKPRQATATPTLPNNPKLLLELAAKARDFIIESFTEDGSAWVYSRYAKANKDGEFDCVKWNPLTDDGDALRLASSLTICVEFGYCADDAPIVRCGRIEDKEAWEMRAHFPDPAAATREAIVRAAALIGMQE